VPGAAAAAGAAAEAPPVDAPPPEPEPAPAPELAAAPPPEPPAPAPVTPASPAEEEESHWRTVFEDFLRVRGQTGEPAAAQVSYDRFRTKLVKNRDQLVQKYNCRTVRFQVYVKEGKAAVRATPVR
jgi:hypothetical protein